MGNHKITNRDTKYPPGSYTVTCYNAVGKKLPHKAYGLGTLGEAKDVEKAFMQCAEGAHSTIVSRVITNSLIKAGSY